MEDWKTGRFAFQPSNLPAFHLTHLLIEVVYQVITLPRGA